MRSLRLISLAAAVALFSCMMAASLVRAGDRSGENQGAKQFTQPAPVKQFDLGKLDLSKPPVEPAPPKAPEQAEQPKAKPIVRYRASELAPEGAEFVLEIPDLQRTYRSAGASPLGKLMSPDALGPAWSRNIVQRMRNLPPAGEGLPNGDSLVSLVERVSGMLSGEVIIGIYPPAEGGKYKRFLLVAGMEGTQRTAFTDSIEDFKSLAGLSRETLAENLTKGDFTFQRLTAKNGLSATWGFVGNQLVVEFGRISPKAGGRQLFADQVLSAALTRGEKSLAREEARAEQVAVLGKDADLYIRADMKALCGLTAPAGVKDRPPMAAWFEGVRYVAAALRFEAGAVREKLFAAMDMESPLGKLMPKAASTSELARFMPLDACYCETSRLSPTATTQSLALAMAALPEEVRAQVDEQIAAIEKKSGLSLEKDIIPAFSGECASAYTVRAVGAVPDIESVLILQPDDMEKIKAVLVGLEKAIAGADGFKTDNYPGTQVRYLEPPKDAAKKEPEKPAKQPGAAFFGAGHLTGSGGDRDLSPLALRLLRINAYAIHGQCVILGSSPRVVKLALRQRDPAQHTSSILDKADFKSARKILGPHQANELSCSYLDLHRVGELLYAAAGASGDIPDLPPADRVLDDMTGMTWVVRQEKQGVSVEVLSPVGLMPLSAAAMAKSALDTIDAMAVAEQLAHTAKLKAIWRGMELFATEFGRYPLSLGELFPAYAKTGALFLTPEQESGEDKVVIEKAEEVEGKTGYRYISGRTPNSEGASLLLYSVKPTVRGTHWCLLANGKVREVSTKVLADMLGTRKPAGLGSDK